MCLAFKNNIIKKYYIFIFLAFLPIATIASQWHLTANDTQFVFTCAIPITNNPDSVIEYLWCPQVLKKLSSRISKIDIISSLKDSQTVMYTFSFLGNNSNATYLRHKSSPNNIVVEQLSFSCNWTLWPKPISSQAKYSVDTLLPVRSLHYSQTVVFNKTIKPWDVLYARILLSQTVTNLEKILKNFTGK